MEKKERYKIKRQKVLQKITELESLGYECDIFLDRLELIDHKLKEEIKENENMNSEFMEGYVKGYMDSSLNKAISEVDSLDGDLVDYLNKVYLSNLNTELTKLLDSNGRVFTKVRTTLLNTISHLKEGSHKTKEERYLEVYNYAYIIIKNEIIKYGKSDTLNVLKNDYNSSYYLQKIIKENISLLDQDNEEYNTFLNYLNYLEVNKCNISYLVDDDLLRMIIGLSLSNKEKEQLITDITSDVNIVDTLFDGISTDIDELEKTSISNKATLKKYKRDFHAGITIGIVTIGVIAALGTLTKISAFRLSSTVEYGGLAESVATDEDYKVETNYYSLDDEGVYAYKHEGSTVVKYDLSSIENLSLDEYLDLDLDALDLNTLSYEDLENFYNEVSVKIERISLDPNDKNYVTNLNSYVKYMILFIMISLILFAAYESMAEALLCENELTLVVSYNKIKAYLDNYQTLKKNNNLTLENLEELKSNLDKLYQDYAPMLEGINNRLKIAMADERDIDKINNIDNKMKSLTRRRDIHE